MHNGTWFMVCGGGCSWKKTIVGSQADLDAAIVEHAGCEHRTEVVDLRERQRPPHRKLRDATPPARERHAAARSAPGHPHNVGRSREESS